MTVQKGNIDLTDRARRLRRDATIAELHLWKAIRASRLGVKFRRQHPCPPFVLDFFCEELSLAIEVDGSSHDSDQAILRDKTRQEFIESIGIRVIRLSDEEVLHTLMQVEERLLAVIADLRVSLRKDQ